MQLARLLVTSPSAMFAALRENPLFALPMWLVLLCSIAVTGWYYGIVDVEWLMDHMTTEAQKAQMAQQGAAAFTPPRSVLLGGSVVGIVIVLFVVMTLGAVYFMLAGAITNVRYSFRQWFAFNWWAGGVPQAVASIPSFLILLLSGSSQMEPSALQPLSLNELIFQRSMGEPGYQLLTSIGLVQVAAAWLTSIGVKTWSGRSWTFAIVFSVLPTVLIYGVWALFAFR